MRKNHTYSIDEATGGLLGRQKNPGRYLDGIVARSWQRASLALTLLRGYKWANNEILNAIMATNAEWIAVESPEFHFIRMEKFQPSGVDPARWVELCDMVRDNDDCAFALDTILGEYWCGNTVLKNELEG